MAKSPAIDLEPPRLRRWLQIVGGVFLALIAVPSVIFSAVLAIEPPPKSPLAATALGVTFVLISLWILGLAIRIIFNRPNGAGLMGPVALRVVAAFLFALPVAAIFTGAYKERAILALVQAAIYIFLGVRLWALARHRSAGPGNAV